MASSPLVSIVIDNYNYARFLPVAIDSALGQSYGHKEIVVVDDGSTDDSAEVIASYGDRVVPVLRDNGGQAAAFNAGLEASRGEIVVFLDADDKLLPRAVEHAVERFDRPDVVNVQWPLWIVDENGRRTGRRFPPHMLLEGDFRERVIREGPHGHLPAPTSGNAWSRDFLERVFPIPESEFPRLADAYFLTLAPVAGRIAKLRRPHGWYRVHGSNEYAGKNWVDTFRQLYEFYDRRCVALSRYLATTGVEVDPAVWTDGNEHHQWLLRLVRASDEIERIVPEGASFILVDEDKWGTRGTLAGRRAIPFVERDGLFSGLPGNGPAAVREVERQRASGAGFIAFVWPSLWCLGYYAGLEPHLRSHYSCVAESDVLVAFDLRER